MSFQKEYAKIVAKCWQKTEFKAEFLKNPEKILQEAGIKVQVGKKIQVVEDTDTIVHIVLPQKPSGEISERDLEAIAGGFGATDSVGDILNAMNTYGN